MDFTSIVKGLKRSKLKRTEKEIETFKQDDRRFSSLTNEYPNIVLPAKIYEEKLKLDKIQLAIFMDVSGSCVSYLPKFEKVVATFESEPNLFELDLYTFDSAVNKIEKSKSYRYGGGTSFSIIENELINIESLNRKYPDGVIVITDGEGDIVSPKFPNRWIWLMTKKFTDRYVPKRSKVYELSKITFGKE